MGNGTIASDSMCGLKVLVFVDILEGDRDCNTDEGTGNDREKMIY